MNDMPVPVPVLAGLVGFPRSGKDTLGDMLEGTGRWKKVAFADALKDLYLRARPCVWWDEPGCHAYDPIRNRAELEQAKIEDEGTRASLQEFGHAVREIDPDFWVLAAARTVAAHMADGYNVVLTDIRYANEFEYVKRKDGIPAIIYPSERAPFSVLTLFCRAEVFEFQHFNCILLLNMDSRNGYSDAQKV